MTVNPGEAPAERIPARRRTAFPKSTVFPPVETPNDKRALM